MTNLDPFAHFDGAYVLGALDTDEQAAFEEHLQTCAQCQQRVHEVEFVPSLLTGVPLAAFEPDAREDVPDTLLPGLISRVRAERRRHRTVTATLAGLAAACLVALTIVLWPSGASNKPEPLAMTALVASPVTATAEVSDRAWGTQIELSCRYAGATLAQDYGYRLVVVDKSGGRHELGTWTLVPGKTIHYTSGTALKRDEIASISIATPSDMPVLTLTL